VASAYRNWYDLAAEEVVRLLAEYRKEKCGEKTDVT